MARMQILELPQVEEPDGYRTPFALVLDQCEPSEYEYMAPHLDAFVRAVGAAAAYVTPGTIDIPANDHTAFIERDEEQDTEVLSLASLIQVDPHSMRDYRR